MVGGGGTPRGSRGLEMVVVRGEGTSTRVVVV